MSGDRIIHDMMSRYELLVQAGASEDDYRILLEDCIKEENTEMAMHLINKGVMLHRVPLTKNLELVKLLASRGAELDSTSFQRYAVSVGKVELLRFLVERDGQLLQLKDFGYIGFEIMRAKETCFMDTLRYLVTDYGHDVNVTFPGHPNGDYHVVLLQRACEENNVNAAKLLLEHGADPECPGLQQSAITYMRSRRGGSGQSITSFSQGPMLILQALVQYSNSEVQSSVAESIRQYKLRSHVDIPMDLADQQVTTTTQASMDLLPSDNFSKAIPWVEETATRFQYDHLKGDDAIRLLVLEPSKSPEDPIRCRLVEVALGENPGYEILSCDWRTSGRAETIPISVNRETFDIPLAAWDALRRARLNDQDRFLWIDAICINQGHIWESQDGDKEGNSPDDLVVRERSQQASHFRDIYEGATQLLVWLGRTADNSNLIFEHLGKCRDHRHLNWCQYRGETEVAFRKLCQRSWFYSDWAVSELALSTKTVMMCGIHECEWPELMKCSCYLSDADYYHPLEGVDGRTHLNHLRGLTSESRKSLRQAVLCNRHCRSDDPRDKVFGMVSLGIDRQLCVPINYGSSAVEIFCEFTRRVIESRQDLEILHWFGPHRHRDGSLSGLPSWVPSFNTLDIVGTLPGIFGSRSLSIHYPSKLLPGARFPSRRTIAVKGWPVEKIKLTGAELKATEATRPGSMDFRNVLGSWERIAGVLRDTKRFPQAVADAFSDTIVGNDECDLVIESDVRPFVRNTRPMLSSKADGFDLWYGKYGAKVLREADPDYFDEVSTIKAWMEVGSEPASKAEQQRKRDHSGRKLMSYARRMEMTCYGRKFFTTDKGSMGLAPPLALPRDEIVFLPGGKYPFVLRPRGDETYEMIGDCFLYDLDVFAVSQGECIKPREFVIA